MTDLVKRLRDNCSCNLPDTPCGAEEQCRNAFEAADRIELLEMANLKQSLITVDHLSHIEKLETALRHCINALRQYEMGDNRPRGPIPNDDLRPWLLGAMDNAIKTLEGKDV